jgi:hypothetical protein
METTPRFSCGYTGCHPRPLWCTCSPCVLYINRDEVDTTMMTLTEKDLPPLPSFSADLVHICQCRAAQLACPYQRAPWQAERRMYSYLLRPCHSKQEFCASHTKVAQRFGRLRGPVLLPLPKRIFVGLDTQHTRTLYQHLETTCLDSVRGHPQGDSLPSQVSMRRLTTDRG